MSLIETDEVLLAKKILSPTIFVYTLDSSETLNVAKWNYKILPPRMRHGHLFLPLIAVSLITRWDR